MVLFFQKILIILSLLSCSCMSSGQSYQRIIVDLMDGLNDPLSDRQRVDLLNNISYNFRRINPDSMLPYAERAYRTAIEINYVKGQSLAQKNIGISKFKSGAPIEDIVSHYEIAVELSELIDDQITIAACLNNIALTYHSSNQLSEALEYFIKALKVYEDSNLENDYVKGLIIGNIGTTFHKIGDIENEFKYITEVIEYADTYDYPRLHSIYIDNLATALVNKKEYRQAIEECKNALIIQKDLGDEQSYLQSLNAMAEAYIGLEDYSSSLKYSTESTTLAVQNNYPLIETEALMVQTKALKYLGRIEEAKASGIKAFEKLSASGRFARGVEVSLLLSDLFKDEGDYQKALFYQDWYRNAEDKRLKEKEKYITADLNQKYKNEIRIKEIEILNQKNKLRQNAIYLLSIFSIILLLMLYGSYLLFRKYKQSSIELLYKNKELKNAEMNFVSKNEELKKYIESNIQLEQFAHIASHDLKSPLRTISSFAGLLKIKAASKLNTSEEGYLSYIEGAVKQMNLLVNDLLIFSKANSQKINIESFNTRDLVDEILSSLHEEIKASCATIEILELPEIMSADRNKIYRVLQNLILNAIKFISPEEQPVIQIKGSLNSSYYTISISDQGIGIKEEFLSKIFSPYTQLHTKSEYDGTGLGLAICKKIIDQHQGTISVDSVYGEGTTFTIELPLNMDHEILVEEKLMV